MTKRTVKILIDGEHIKDTESICGALTDSGLDIDVAFHKVGLVFGAISENKIKQLRKIKGIAKIDDEKVLRAIETKPSRNGKTPAKK